MSQYPQPSFMPLAFEESLVRMVPTGNGDPCFVAKDVALALGYEWNGSARIAHVPDEWRGVTSVVTPSGVQEVLTLTEQGLYFFLGRSDKPKALPFQKWLAGEVLPTLRKQGSYGAPALDLPLMTPGTISHEQLHKLLAVWAMLARMPFEALRDQLFGMFGIGDLQETPQEVLQRAGEHVLRQNNALLAQGCTPDHAAVAAYERRVDVWREPEAARLFWQLWPALSREHKLNHSRNADLIALRLPETAAAVHAAGLPFTLTELRAVLPHSRTYRCLGASRTVNSLHLGKTVRCMVFYTPQPQQDPEVRS